MFCLFLSAYHLPSTFIVSIHWHNRRELTYPVLLPSSSDELVLPVAGFWASAGTWQVFSFIQVYLQFIHMLCAKSRGKEG